MSRDRLTRATPDIAEPDTDRPKTDGARQSYPTDRDEDGGIIVGDVVSRETVLGNRQL